MSNYKEMTLNRMPAITWYWLKLNDRQVKVPVEGTDGAPVVTVPEALAVSNDYSAFDAVKCGAGDAYSELLANSAVDVYTAAAGVEVEEPIRIKYNLEDGASVQKRYGIYAAARSKVTMIVDIESAEDASGVAALQTRVVAEENAHVQLVYIHRAGKGFQIIDDFGAECAEKANVEVIQVVFSGKENDLGGRVNLTGEKSMADIKVGYVAANADVMDMNYYVVHEGPNAESNIYGSGVLRDTASKIFRGTIDFVKGASGAKGEENEDVLLMNEGVSNKCVPTILCNEENVEGNHGHTVGKLSDEILFYCESRGIPADEIYEMMAKARLESIFSQIPDEKTVDELREYNEKGNE